MEGDKVMKDQKKKFQIKDILMLQIVFFIYSINRVVAKFASGLVHLA